MAIIQRSRRSQGPADLSNEDKLEHVLLECLEVNRPLPAEFAPLVDSLANEPLLRIFESSRCRDELRHPSAELVPQAKCDALFRPRRISLSGQIAEKSATGRANPQPFHVLTELRRQWHRTLSELPEPTQSRLVHLIQVLAEPAGIGRRFRDFRAVTFSTSRLSNAVPATPVKLDWVNLQWLETGADHRHLILGDAAIDVDDTGQLWARTPARSVWNFDTALSKGRGSGHSLPMQYRATLANGLAMHEAIETLLVSAGKQASSTTSLDWPELLVAANAAARGQFSAQDLLADGQKLVPEAATMVETAVEMLRKRDFNREWASKALQDSDAASGSQRASATAWLRPQHLSDEALQALRRSRDNTFETVVESLGSLSWDFIRGVLLAEVLVAETPPGDSPQSEVDVPAIVEFFPVRFYSGNLYELLSNSELYVRFNSRHRGRDVWSADGVRFDDTFSAVQILRL